MKIMKSTLKQIIKEEMNKLLKESTLLPQEEKDRQFMDYIYTSAYSMSGFEDPEFEAIKDAYMEARESLSIKPLMMLHGKNKLFNMIYAKYQEEHGV